MIALRKREPPPWLDEPVEHHGQFMLRVFDIGDCWYATWNPTRERWQMYPDKHGVEITLAPEHRGVRPIVVVVPYGELPMGMAWCVHTGTNTSGSGWTVSGGIEGVPDITVHPSLLFRGADIDGNLVERWHGWIRDGHLVGA